MTTMKAMYRPVGRRWATKAFQAAAAFLAVAVALVSYRYLPEVGPLAPNVMENLFARPWLAAHAAGAATALLVGSLQFLPVLRRRWPVVHRWTGRLYVLGCLEGGIAGLVLAFGASTGPVAGVGFGLLAVLWLVTTALGWRTAMERRFDEHRRWMIRSWALTLAAVTLRLYLPLSMLVPLAAEDSYRAIAWLCWVPNILIAEWWLRRRTASAPQAGM